MAVQLSGLESIDTPSTAAEIIASSPRPGDVLDEDAYERSKSLMRRILADSGYAFARVSGRVEVDLARHEARVRFEIEAGKRAKFGAITISGLIEIPDNKVRQSLFIAAGEDYSAAALEDARRALVNLGVFASVNVDADTSNPASGVVPVRFTVRETAPRTLRLGGGARLDALQLSGSLTAGWEHRNFLGGLRHFSVEARPGVVLFPTRMSDFPSLEAPNRAMLEGALEARFAQPSFLEDRTRGLLSAELGVRPLLYTDTAPDESLLGFLELATRAGLERPFLSHQLFVTPSLNWQAAIPVDYRRLSIGELSPPVQSQQIDNLFIAYPEIVVRLDLRDDPLDPRRGLLLSNSLQVALPALGGSVSDLRIRPEARFYVTKANLTLALRATTGLLFPRDYGIGETSEQSADDQQALLFRGFFSGGPFSNRGYSFQGVGEHAPLLFSTAVGVRCTVTGTPLEEIDPRCLRPIGGLTLWEMSLELRFPLGLLAPLGAVLFLDASDVRPGRAEYSHDKPHLAPGFGLRYPTPIGPVRLDVGFRVLEFLGEEQPQGNPPYVFGAPIALHLAIGQAF
jgi:outer membrane protein insertion porin family/translocation and assembly module TamA